MPQLSKPLWITQAAYQLSRLNAGAPVATATSFIQLWEMPADEMRGLWRQRTEVNSFHVFRVPGPPLPSAQPRAAHKLARGYMSRDKQQKNPFTYFLHCSFFHPGKYNIR